MMTAAELRFEQELDMQSEAERQEDLWLSGYYDEPDIDPEDCDHSDKSWSHLRATCDLCGAEGIVLVNPDWEDEEIETVIVFL